MADPQGESPAELPDDPEATLHRNRDRAESFGAVAAAYDRARPGYPDALIVDLASRGGTRALDVGCGTGKAAVALAAAGLQVLGVEVDPAMSEVARAHGIEVEVGSFEMWDPAGRTFDLLTCGQAWHWIDPVVGSHKAFAVLRRFGTVALFWNVHAVAADQVPALDEVYARLAPELASRTRGVDERSKWTGGAGTMESAVAELEAAGFADVRTREFPWEQVYRRAEWLELLSTFSDHHLLPDDQRGALLTALGDVVDAHGGKVTVHYRTHVLLAQKP